MAFEVELLSSTMPLVAVYYFKKSGESINFVKQLEALATNEKNVDKKSKMQEPKRPQTPKPPYSYHEEEISYENKADGITISGTLTVPAKEGTFPAVLLVSGMGPNDRDYSMLGHKLFLVLADYLTRHGIAVLRVDKRGIDKSTGTFDATVTSADLARDVQAGVAYLKTRSEINSNQIGLIGHSEGGMIASMVAADCADVAFLTLLAGVATTSAESVIQQVAAQLRADGATQQTIDADSEVRKQLLAITKQEANVQVAELKMSATIASYCDSLPEELAEESERFLFTIKKSKADEMIAFFNSPGYRYWLGYDPATALARITIPVLALNGDLDFIMLSKIYLPIVSQALRNAGNDNVTIHEIKNANHWFQIGETGSMAEYGTIEETISPEVLQLISDWILARVG